MTRERNPGGQKKPFAFCAITDMGYSRVPTPEPRAYARPTALREGADDDTYIASADLPHHPIDPYESCEPLVLVLLVPDITLICMESRQGYVPV